MIEHTFCHVGGIGAKLEKFLWSSKIYDWQTFFAANNVPLSQRKFEIIYKTLEKSKKELKNHNHRFFSEGLPPNQHWRLFNNFRTKAAYLDIETTGLSPQFNVITTIVIYDGKNIKYYVNGDNLSDFKNDIKDYELLITYNGKCFDVPFIENFFKIKLKQSHIDLRYILNSLGYSGGLKNCEKGFSISRNDLEGVDGYFAVLLWNEYKKNHNRNALETLLAYNIEDVVNLEYLMGTSYNLKIKETPFAKLLAVDISCKPKIPFKPDISLVSHIKGKMSSSFNNNY